MQLSPPQPAGLRNWDVAAFSPLKKLAALVIFNHAISVTGEKEASYPVTGGKGGECFIFFGRLTCGRHSSAPIY